MTQPAAPRPPAEADRTSGSTSRRKFLGAIGVGVGTAAAVGVGVPAVAGATSGRGGGDRDGDGGRDRDGRRGDRRRGDGERGVMEVNGSEAGPDRFSRLFDDLEPFAESDEGLLAALTAIGAPGGIMDANDPLELGPIRLITEPDLSPNNRDNPQSTAGSTFVGQFLDHDLTRDAGSNLGQPTSVRRSTNLRTARFDLDSVYGGGPAESPELYTADDPFVFRVESGGLFEDVPRGSDGSAIIADPRNDENLMISGLQVALLKFHNAVIARVRSGGLDGQAAFDEAQRQVRWHWQWLIVHEFLPQFVGQDLIADIDANGRRFYNPRTPRIPVEFSTAAYRFGHSIIRPSYRANLAGDDGEPFFGFVFDPSQFGVDDPDDFTGGSRAPRRFIGWQTFFDFEDGEVKPNKRIDAKMSTPMFQLPIFAIGTDRGEPVGPTSLATRNLHRHVTWGIPSGQAVAAAMGVAPLSAGDLSDFAGFHPTLDRSTPLWLYTLHEADVVNDGLILGPVGGRIVAEVFLGLLDLDPTSYRNDPNWRPTLPSASGAFRMTDLLTIAGVDPATRGQ